MKPSDVRVLGAVAAFEIEGYIMDRRRIASRAALDDGAAWHSLNRLVAAGVQRVDFEEDSVRAPTRYYGLTDRAAAALDALDGGG